MNGVSGRSAAFLEEMGIAPRWTLRVSAPAFEAPAPADGESGASAPTDEQIAQMDWAGLRAAVAACTRCSACKGGRTPVHGSGARTARWLVVAGASTAADENEGVPLAGEPGKLLDNMLAAIGLARGHDVYIANAVKCRPPENRTPEAEEMVACLPFLQRQIELIQPKLIVALGRPAAQTLLQTEVKIGAARGRLHQYKGIPVIVTYHPAYLLRTLHDKAKAWEDLCFMRQTMRARP